MSLNVLERPEPFADSDPIYTALCEAVDGDTHRVVTDPDILATYGRDFTHIPDKGQPQIVVRPTSPEEIQAILKVANAQNVPVIPWSAGWGLGTSLALEGGIVIDMRLMKEIIEIDEDSMYVLVEPGVTYEELTPKLRERGLVISIPDAPAQVSVLANHTNFGIGGYLQMHGMGPDLVLGLEAVLPTGEDVIRTGTAALEGRSWFGRYAYNPIPDLAGIFLGSMGTLGVVTKLAIRLFHAPEEVVYRKFGFPDIGTAARCAKELTRRGIADRIVGFSWFFLPEATRKLADRVTGEPLSQDELKGMREEVADLPECYFFVGVHDTKAVAPIRAQEMESVVLGEFGAEVMKMSDDDVEKYENIARGKPQQQSERAILGAKGKYKGAYGTYVSYTPVHNWEKMYESWGKIAGEYGHPLAMNTKMFPQGRFSSFRFILSYFDQNDPKDRKRIADMCDALEAEALKLGGASGGTTSETLRQLKSYPLYAAIKRALDPNGIMHPSMGDWQG